jgi:hypothetical protein
MIQREIIVKELSWVKAVDALDCGNSDAEYFAVDFVANVLTRQIEILTLDNCDFCYQE